MENPVCLGGRRQSGVPQPLQLSVKQQTSVPPRLACWLPLLKFWILAAIGLPSHSASACSPWQAPLPYPENSKPQPPTRTDFTSRAAIHLFSVPAPSTLAFPRWPLGGDLTLVPTTVTTTEVRCNPSADLIVQDPLMDF